MRSVTFILLLLISYSVHSQPEISQLRGTIRDNETAIPCDSCQIQLVGMDTVIYSDSDGKYSLKNIKPGTYDVRITSPVEIKTYTGVVFNPNKITFLEVKITAECEYNENSTNVCPVCNKSDKTLKISYGLHSFESKKEYREFKKKYYEGGCVLTECQPSWYCKRNRLKY